MDAELRERLWARSKGYCEKCGLPMSHDVWAAHHRKLRKHGGKDEITNLLIVHHGCHNGHTDSIHLMPASALMNGWLVSSWENPRLKPILLHGPRGRWVTLTDAGGYMDGCSCLECGRIWENPSQARVCSYDDKARPDETYDHDPEEEHDGTRDDHTG